MTRPEQKAATKVTGTAHAKLNLFLHVVGRRADGFHELESLFAFTQGGDLLSAELSQDISLDVDGPFASALNASGSKTDNLVLKAAHCLQRRAAYRGGAHIRLTKKLPIASGIGGGSADAAATLLALNQLWGLDLPLGQLEQIGLSLGADVPACLHSAPLKVGGIGEKLEEVILPRGYGVLLVNPGQSVSTPAVFQQFHKVPGEFSQPLLEWAPEGGANFIKWLTDQTVNDLAEPASSLCADIAEVLEALGACEGALLVRMSGSGATCFSLFETGAEAGHAQKKLSAAHPGWWTFADQLIPAYLP